MASSYALPTPPLPHNHSHHGHGHVQSLSHSQSPPSFGHSRRADRNSSNGGSNTMHTYSQSLESLPSAQGYGPAGNGGAGAAGGQHSRSQSHDSDHAQAAHALNLSSYKANSFAPLQQRRDHRPTPISSRKASPSNLSPVIDMSPASPGQNRTDYLDAPVQGRAHRHAAHRHEHDHEHAHEHAHNHGHDHGHAHHGHHDHSHSNGHSHSHSHGHDHHGHHDHGLHDHHHHHHHHHDHAHDHHGHDHKHGHSHAQTYSKLTSLLLPYTSRWPLLHSVMTEKDSRRIFYFMIVNFSFMGVQAFYGYITDSLGLLSDSIHMFFDCVALAVGLFAAVMSKWSPNQRFPYGFGKIETLSGFANGVFLILISVEIMFEGVERLLEGRETKRLLDLFVVSTLGLLVNLLGIFAFGSHSHAHHGHDHGHDHGHGHAHGHDNENMHGIYLHIMADMLGSASVIASTVLTYFVPWAGWDPLASFLIAYLIAITALPLVTASARRLLLTNPDDAEYTLRNTLSGLTDVRGVAAYAVPKFWADDRTGDGDGHDHHDHHHDHHDHDHAGGGGGCPSEAAAANKTKLLGVIHVAAARGADPDDVRDRVRAYLADQHMDVTVQVEREGDASCWCGMGRLAAGGLNGGPRSPGLPPGSSMSSLY